MKRKICVVTGTRAEYGLLYWIIKGIYEDKNLQLQLVVTGAHLSHEFGLTYKVIEKDGFKIDEKVEILTSDDSAVGIAKSTGQGVIGCAKALHQLKPDIMVVLGDRFEILAACTAATIARIPIAHIHGGELTKGAYDEAMRHCITKMAHFHFTAAEPYRKRVIQLGEHPDTVFCYGAPGLDSIQKLSLLNKEAFEKSIDFKLGKKNILATFHPATLDQQSPTDQLKELLKALDQFKGVKIIFTYPNAEIESSELIQMLIEYAKRNQDHVIAVPSLGQLRYLSAIQHVDVVIGNSSSGIIEVPSFKIPTVNIGDRQEGRIMAKTVLCCPPARDSIISALQKAFSKNFRESLKTVQNPYGTGNASGKILEKLKHVRLGEQVLKKTFYNL